MARLFHVSSAANRDSIRVHGLGWSRMGAVPGIAGSLAPEADGVFLCADEFEAGFFVQMNNTGGQPLIGSSSMRQRSQVLRDGR